ncbi:hypothetical protein A9320_27740 [Ruegeria sp. PBVC088]|nr:hypothetical protein A9320_27740 [Ruegeria sp. PBVC088]
MTLRIKHYLRQANLTQAELAAKLDITTGYMSNLAQGKRVPSPQMLQRIAEALGVRVSDIMEEPATGFEEAPVQFEDIPMSDVRAICRALGITAGQPTICVASRSAPAFAVSKGDKIVADLSGPFEAPGLVLATFVENGAGRTELCRNAPPWLIRSETSDEPTRVNGNGDVAIVARVAGIYRLS